MNLRDYKKLVRVEAVEDLEAVLHNLERLQERLYPKPPVMPGAPVVGEDIPMPTAEEIERELERLPENERDLLLAVSALSAIVDDLRLVLPAKPKEAA